MAHLDAYIESCPAYGWEGAPAFNTRVEPLKNKRARRQAEWSSALWTFSLQFVDGALADWLQVRDMHAVCRGRFHAFRLRNQLFFHAQAWDFARGDGVTVEFQLGRRVTIGGETYTTEVHALSIADDAITPTVYVNGVEADATFDTRTGKVTFDVAPDADDVLAWDGYFDFWVRFATDDLPYTVDSVDSVGFVVNGAVTLVQTEPPDDPTPPEA